MGEQTKIAWADHTFNPWIGCSKVHTGCQNCYAETYGRRFGVEWGPNGTRRRTSESYWKQPLRWNRRAEKAGIRYRVFPSLCDIFEDRPDLEPMRREFFDLIDRTPNLDWLLLTKRPENVRRMWPITGPGPGWNGTLLGYLHKPQRPNVWLLYSASDQDTLEAGLPHLLACRDLVPVLGLSLEPLIGPVDLSGNVPGQRMLMWDKPWLREIDWVIVGGESGLNARPCNVDWIRSIRDQCRAAVVPCFVKQLGANVLHTGPDPRLDWPVGAWDHKTYSVTLRDPKGGDPDEWPADMRVREMPRRAAGKEGEE